MGFALTPEEAQTLIDEDPKNKDVLFLYLNGQDLNSHPEQQPSRWVINFFDWPLERTAEGSWFEGLSEKKAHKTGKGFTFYKDEPTLPKKISEKRKKWLQKGIVPIDYPYPVAADYLDCLKIVEEKVKQQRAKLIGRNPSGTQRGVYWWRYGRDARNLYKTINGMKKILVKAQVSKTWAWTFLPNGWVYDSKILVFAFEKEQEFALLQSGFHWIWSVQYGTTLRQDLSYTPTTNFETFPFPNDIKMLEDVGQRFFKHRHKIMLEYQEGLTKIFNRVHNPKETSIDIQIFRDLHVEMDNMVAQAYGWSDLALDHNFHETKEGIRFTISEPARREILDRLLQLNHERYAEEVAQGLHDKGKKKKATRTKKSEKTKNKDTNQRDLFSD
ncbi:MAG: hypothetical protein GY795_13020 [Desulfobacterales bacterium]|nr:hypothetical protein [Desulfobacterales bacterium]